MLVQFDKRFTLLVKLENKPWKLLAVLAHL
jgi:ACT domain-containing protein